MFFEETRIRTVREMILAEDEQARRSALAKLLLAAGDGDEARAVLAPVYGWFTEGNTTADLVGARTLLSEIG